MSKLRLFKRQSINVTGKSFVQIKNPQYMYQYVLSTNFKSDNIKLIKNNWLTHKYINGIIKAHGVVVNHEIYIDRHAVSITHMTSCNKKQLSGTRN